MLLVVRDLFTSYGEIEALHGVSFEVAGGSLVTLLGRNGAGKTTTIKSIMGLVRARSGQVLLEGETLLGLRPHKIARKGVGFVPEDRRIFRLLTVEENLELAVHPRDGEGWSLEEVYSFFPMLKDRRRNKGSQLSGGEQQMLAIARVLRRPLRILLLDEPTEGLAPLIVRSIGRILGRLREMGKTMLLVEQNVRFAMELADYHFILSQGRIVHSGTTEEILGDKEVMQRYLGV
jgi:branched-chain amino acid transport system ATP-binding protein